MIHGIRHSWCEKRYLPPLSDVDHLEELIAALPARPAELVVF